MGNEFLGDDVLVNGTEVYGQFVCQQLLIHDVLGKICVFECESHKKARVRQVELELLEVDARWYAHVGVVGVVGREDGFIWILRSSLEISIPAVFRRIEMGDPVSR